MAVTVAVRSKGEPCAFEAASGDAILHAGLKSGLALPYECGTGTCGTCKAKLIEGDVHSRWPEAPGQKSLKRDAGEFLMCQGVPRGDVTIEVARAVAPMGPGACVPAAVDAVIRRIARLTHDVVRLDVEPARPVRFEAGQFMLMTVPDIEGARAYSMVNFSLHASALQFVIKKKPGGVLSEWLFSGDATGTGVALFGPLGAATFHPDDSVHLLLIAGGSGVAGMMSILECAAQHGYFEDHAGHLFFGVRTPRDAFFLEELTALRARCGASLEITIALSDEDLDPAQAERHPGLTFSRGYVHRVAGDAMKGRFDRIRAYAAGPPVMVEATLRMLLAEARLRPADIRYDKFS
jgi:toluene monooxygenase electron transfer component